MRKPLFLSARAHADRSWLCTRAMGKNEGAAIDLVNISTQHLKAGLPFSLCASECARAEASRGRVRVVDGFDPGEGIDQVSVAAAQKHVTQPKVAQYILHTLREKHPSTEDEHLITGRELEILNLLAEGLVKKQIAVHLQISPFTVAAHVRSIYHKLHVVNAPAAVHQAYRKGILPIT